KVRSTLDANIDEIGVASERGDDIGQGVGYLQAGDELGLPCQHLHDLPVVLKDDPGQGVEDRLDHVVHVKTAFLEEVDEHDADAALDRWPRSPSRQGRASNSSLPCSAALACWRTRHPGNDEPYEGSPLGWSTGRGNLAAANHRRRMDGGSERRSCSSKSDPAHAQVFD